MLRNILFYILMAPLTIYYSLKMSRMDIDGTTLREQDQPALVWATRLVRLLKPRLEIDLSELDPNGHYVFMANHQSNFDIPILTSSLKDYSVRYVAKKSLFDIPFFGPALRHAGNICIDRSNRRSAMTSLNEAVDRIKGGVSPIIFPEGTRNPDIEELMDFKIGGIVLALKTELPVAPLVLSGTGRLLPKRHLFFRRQVRVRLKALPVIDTTEWTLKQREEFMAMLRDRMNTAYKEMEKEALA